MTGNKPDGLLAKHCLLLQIIYTDWATKLDHKVAATIIERYISNRGNARASLRFIESATHSTRPNVIASLRRLVENEAIVIIREGAGTRPTEYGLNFEFPSGIAGDTAGRGIAGDTSRDLGGIVGDTSSGIVDDTSSRRSGIAGDTESLLLSPLTSRGQVRDTSAPGIALGLAASAARASVRLTITQASIEPDGGDTCLTISMVNEAGDESEDSMYLEHRTQSEQDAGARRFQQLLDAADLAESPTEISELVGLSLEMADDDYVPANQPWKRQAMGLAA